MSRKFFNFPIIFLKIGPLRPRRRFSLAKQEKVWHNKCSVKRCPPESISRSVQAHNFIFGDVPKRLKGPHSKCGRRLKSAREFESLHLRQIVLTKKMHSKNAARKCGVFAFKRKNRRIQNRKVRFSKRGSAHSENGGLGDAHGPFYAIR